MTTDNNLAPDEHGATTTGSEYAHDEDAYGPDHYGPAIALVTRLLREGRTPGGRGRNGKQRQRHGHRHHGR